ncbi:DNA-binding response regulator [Kangiella sp. HD9-110m-PIT-SAG07]|nr:DNA-binding response regulator [Kangiella sp. HD9-110m-PIT-SAG07]
MNVHKIIIADDHPLFLQGVKNALTSKNVPLYIEEANSYVELFSLLEHDSDDIDLILMDLHMPGAESDTGIHYIRKLYPEIPLVVISAHDTIDVKINCLERGASDFFSKSLQVEELVNKIQSILNGDYQYPTVPNGKVGTIDGSSGNIEKLTPAQFKVLLLIADGHANKAIAYKLKISEKTVKNHISAIFEKLDVTNRTQASNLFLKNKTSSK